MAGFRASGGAPPTWPFAMTIRGYRKSSASGTPSNANGVSCTQNNWITVATVNTAAVMGRLVVFCLQIWTPAAKNLAIRVKRGTTEIWSSGAPGNSPISFAAADIYEDMGFDPNPAGNDTYTLDVYNLGTTAVFGGLLAVYQESSGGAITRLGWNRTKSGAGVVPQDAGGVDAYTVIREVGIYVPLDHTLYYTAYTYYHNTNGSNARTMLSRLTEDGVQKEEINHGSVAANTCGDAMMSVYSKAGADALVTLRLEGRLNSGLASDSRFSGSIHYGLITKGF